MVRARIKTLLLGDRRKDCERWGKDREGGIYGVEQHGGVELTAARHEPALSVLTAYNSPVPAMSLVSVKPRAKKPPFVLGQL